MLVSTVALFGALGVPGQAMADAVSKLDPNYVLFMNQDLVNSSCTAKAIMQSDGNFVLLENQRGVHPVWASNTVGKANYVVMQGDGNVVAYNWAGTAMWSSRTGGFPGGALFMQDDGNLVMRDASGSARWATNTPFHSCCSGNICTDPCVSPVSAGTCNSSRTSAFAGIDVPGGDYQRLSMTTPNPYVCASWCSQDGQCQAYTYVPPGVQQASAVCYLKNVVHFPQPLSGHWSGAVQRATMQTSNF